MRDEAPVKRWTAKRKSAVVIEIFKGKVTLVEVAPQHRKQWDGLHPPHIYEIGRVESIPMPTNR